MWIYEKILIFIFAPAYEWKLILNFEAIILKLVALYYVSWVYLEIIGNLQHDKEIISIAKNTRALKKQIFTEMLLLDCWISFITNQVLIELLHICGKELPNDQHNCTGSWVFGHLSLNTFTSGLNQVVLAKTAGLQLALHGNISIAVNARELFKRSKDLASNVVCNE